MQFRFRFNERKALEALSFVAARQPGLTPLYVAKIFFYAEKYHINKYGRPIVADNFKAMVKGPVPSTIKNFIDANWKWIDRPEDVDEAFLVDRSGYLPRIMPGRNDFDLSHLSESDKECLSEAIAFCVPKNADYLSHLTHLEKSWAAVDLNESMNYFDFVDDDNPRREEILSDLDENASYAVL